MTQHRQTAILTDTRWIESSRYPEAMPRQSRYSTIDNVNSSCDHLFIIDFRHPKVSNAMSQVFFQIAPGTLWGDYGRILAHGESVRKSDIAEDRLYNRDLPLVVDRTGPFVPPLFIGGVLNALIVPEASRQILHDKYSELFRFRPVELGKVVWLEWHLWNFDTDFPDQLPDNGEPENYILERTPSKEAALAIGQLWEIELPMGATMECEFDPDSLTIEYQLSEWNGQDVFYAEKPVARMRRLFCTADGKARLEQLKVAPFVEFIEVARR
ncbi:MAG: hypothetical protein KDB23_07640 [Planctomycetales bacterium]|nr:hypothetical protein [Planctomycetales bacterium]